MGRTVLEFAVGFVAPCCTVTVEAALSVVDATDGAGTAVDSVMSRSLLQTVVGKFRCKGGVGCLGSASPVRFATGSGLRPRWEPCSSAPGGALGLIHAVESGTQW